MKIMMITPYFSPTVGGLENYALNMALALKVQGHEVVVVTTRLESSHGAEGKTQGLRIIRLPILVKLSNTPVNPLWRWQLKKIIRAEKPDVINPHTPVPYISDMATRAAGETPVVITYHNDLTKPKGVGKYLAKLFYAVYINKTLHKSTRIITTSEYYAKTSLYINSYSNKTSIVPPGIDTQRFNLKVDKEWLKKKYPEKSIILFVGGMDKSHAHKGLDVLIQSIVKVKKSIPNIQLVVVGKGNFIPKYQALIKELGLEKYVDFTGFVSNEELPKYYAGADVFILPSTTQAEGFGMVLLEALACGTSVIGSRVGGIPAFIHPPHNGSLVNPGDVNALQKEIKKVLKRSQQIPKNAVHDTSYSMTANSWEQSALLYAKALETATKPLIVQVIPHYPPYLGGMELRVRDLTESLNKNGLEVLVLTSDQKTNAHIVKKQNLTIKYLRSIEIATTPLIPQLFFQILRLPKRSIVHSHVALAFTPEVAFLAAKLRGLPYIAHIRLDVQPSGIMGVLLRPYKKFILGPVLRHSDAIIVLNEGYRDLMTKLYHIDSSKIQVIPNATDFPISTKLNSILHKPIRILLIGRLSHQKNIALLLNATKKLLEGHTSLVTTIVGDGEDKAKLQKLTKELGIRRHINFKGRLDGKDLIKAYADSDIVVQTSYEEGFSTVLIETLASGKPLIATDITGTRDVIKDGFTGLLVNPHSVEELVMALNKLITSDDLRNKLVKQGIAEVKKYSWAEVGSATEHLYMNVKSGLSK